MYYCQRCKTDVETYDKFIEQESGRGLLVDCMAYCKQCNRANFEGSSRRKADLDVKIKARKQYYKWIGKRTEAEDELASATKRNSIGEQAEARARIAECERKMTSLQGEW